MNLKILLLSTLFVAIAYTTCAEARKSSKSRHSSSSNRRTSVTHHSSSRHTNSGSGSGSRHSSIGGHHSSPSTYPKQQSHYANTGYVANHHSDTSYNKPVYGVNSHNQNTHSDDNTPSYVARSTRRRHRNRHRTRKTTTTTTTKKPCIKKDPSLNNNHAQQNLNDNCDADIPAEISTHKPTKELRNYDSNLDDADTYAEISTKKPSRKFFGADVGFLRY